MKKTTCEENLLKKKKKKPNMFCSEKHIWSVLSSLKSYDFPMELKEASEVTKSTLMHSSFSVSISNQQSLL